MVSHDSYRMHNLSITIPCLIYFKFSLFHILSQDIEVNYDPLSEEETSCKRLTLESNLGMLRLQQKRSLAMPRHR